MKNVKIVLAKEKDKKVVYFYFICDRKVDIFGF